MCQGDVVCEGVKCEGDVLHSYVVCACGRQFCICIRTVVGQCIFLINHSSCTSILLMHLSLWCSHLLQVVTRLASLPLEGRGPSVTHLGAEEVAMTTARLRLLVTHSLTLLALTALAVLAGAGTALLQLLLLLLVYPAPHQREQRYQRCVHVRLLTTSVSCCRVWCCRFHQLIMCCHPHSDHMTS